MTIDETLVQDAPTAPVDPATDESTDTLQPAQKRKASLPGPDGDNDSSNSPKRMRRDSETIRNGPARPPAVHLPADQRQSASTEEKKRGKRLFGGLLSTLSQTSNPPQRRKQDIERRQQARVAQQKPEEDKHRDAGLAKIKAVRKQEQIHWEERVLRTKHSHLLDTARFLQTHSEPRLYYLPWELTEDQEDLIKDQIHDAETLIEKEIREFKQKKDQRLTDLGVFIKPASEQESAPKPRSPTPQKGQADMEKLQGKVDTDALPDNRAQNDSTNEITNGEPFEHANKVGNHHDKESDEAGDVMVEGDEDTVIY